MKLVKGILILCKAEPAPDHSTIARFRSIYFAPVCESLMAQFTKIRLKKYHLKKLLKKLKRLSIKENIVFVHGKGRRKLLIQKAIEKLNEYINRFR